MTDENDNSPKFIGNGKPIVAVIPNAANFGYPVTRVEATDEDAGLNAEIRYSLLNEPTKLFEIDDVSGNIRVIGPITNDQRVYGFDVKATDRKGAEDGRSSIVNVFVSIHLNAKIAITLNILRNNIRKMYVIRLHVRIFTTKRRKHLAAIQLGTKE